MQLKGEHIQSGWTAALFFLLVTAGVLLLQLPIWYLFGACIIPFFFLAFQYPKALLYILLYAIPFSIEFAVSSSLATDLPDEPLMIICSFMALAVAASQQNLKKWWRSSIIMLLVLQVFWLAIAVALSSDTLVSVKFFAAKLWYLGAFISFPLLVLTKKQHIEKAAIFFTAAMMLCTLWVLVQHAARGFSFAEINESVQPFFRNHVNYSVALVCIIPILLAGIKWGKKRWKAALVLLLCIALAALYFSYARGAWLALLIGIFSFWLLKKRLLLWGFLTAVFICCISVFYFVQGDRYEQYAPDYKTTIYHTNFSEHLAATYSMKDVSTAERIHRWVAGARMVGDHWQTGSGPATFYPAYKEYTTPAFKTWVSNNPERSTVHNYFLLTLIEQGVPGLLLLLLILGYAFYTAQKVYYRTTDIFWRIAVSVSSIILVQLCVLNFLSDLVETDKGGSLFYLSLAIIVICDRKTRELQLTPHIQRIP